MLGQELFRVAFLPTFRQTIFCFTEYIFGIFRATLHIPKRKYFPTQIKIVKNDHILTPEQPVLFPIPVLFMPYCTYDPP